MAVEYSLCDVDNDDNSNWVRKMCLGPSRGREGVAVVMAVMMVGGRCTVTSGGDVSREELRRAEVKVKLVRGWKETVAVCATTTDLVR